MSKYVTIRHPVVDGMVETSNESTTTASGWAITPDGGIACELLEGGVHAEFGLLYTGYQHLVAVKEVLQFFVAVLNVIAVELQKPETLKGMQVLDRKCSSEQMSWVRWRGTAGRSSPWTRGSNVFAPCPGTSPLWWVQQVGLQGGEAPQGQPPVIC